MEVALFQPDQPQNTGTILRLGACLGIKVHIIDPCGFAFSEKAIRRSAMDYIDHVRINRHTSWEHFNQWRCDQGKQLVLLTTKSSVPYYDHTYKPESIILLGQESCGVPDSVHHTADARVLIPMHKKLRSLNMAVAASMVLGEALRQTNQFRIL